MAVRHAGRGPDRCLHGRGQLESQPPHRVASDHARILHAHGKTQSAAAKVDDAPGVLGTEGGHQVGVDLEITGHVTHTIEFTLEVHRRQPLGRDGRTRLEQRPETHVGQLQVSGIDAVVPPPLTSLHAARRGEPQSVQAAGRAAVIRAEAMGVEHPPVLSDRHDRDQFQPLGKLHRVSERHGRFHAYGAVLDRNQPGSKEKIASRRITGHVTGWAHGQFDGAATITDLLQALPPAGGAGTLSWHGWWIPPEVVCGAIVPRDSTRSIGNPTGGLKREHR